MSFPNAQETGRPVAILDEGITLTPNVNQINFTGAGVTGTNIGDSVTENIPGGSGAVWITESVTGIIDGANKTFTISHTPVSGSLQLRIDRQPQEQGASLDYTISGSTITYNTAPDASLAGQPHVATYQY